MTVTGQRHISLVLADRILELLQESGASEAERSALWKLPKLSFRFFQMLRVQLRRMRLLVALRSRSHIGYLCSNCLKFCQNLPHNRNEISCVCIVHEESFRDTSSLLL